MYVQLEDERGQALERLDEPGVAMALERLRPALEDESSRCWGFIDPYGDTVFNHLQVKPFLQELETVKSRARPDEARFLEKLEELARRCRDGIHLYLKFYGD